MESPTDTPRDVLLDTSMRPGVQEWKEGELTILQEFPGRTRIHGKVKVLHESQQGSWTQNYIQGDGPDQGIFPHLQIPNDDNSYPIKP